MIQKRILKKVRRPFLHHYDRQAESDSDSEQSDSNVHVINSCIGIIDINGKVHVTMGFLNPFVKINDYKIDHSSYIRTVSIHLDLHNEPAISNENVVQSLEANGNHDHQAWAEIIRRYMENRPKMVEDLINSFNTSDAVALARLRKAKNRAILACKEIETKYSYSKIVTFSSREALDILLIAYSEGFIQKLNHNTLKEFIEWTKEHGLPQTFNGDCPEHTQFIKDFFNFSMLKGDDNIVIRPECSPSIYNKTHQLHPFKAQYAHIFEPAAEGFFTHWYLIFKDESSVIKTNQCPLINDIFIEEKTK